MLCKNLAKAYSGMLTIDTTGLNGKFGSWFLTVLYSFSGELPDGMRFAIILLS